MRLARENTDDRVELAVNGVLAADDDRAGIDDIRPRGLKILDAQQPLRQAVEFRRAAVGPADDQKPRKPTANLRVHDPMAMWVIPVRALGMIGRDLDRVMVLFARFDVQEGVVGIAQR
ncbi:MAG: hypothetical protein JW395_0718 [Nitrospira sp.]|nr:hypothetical protein [Nitrospira sp.]